MNQNTQNEIVVVARLVTKQSKKTDRVYQCIEVEFPDGEVILCFDDRFRMKVLETLVQRGDNK